MNPELTRHFQSSSISHRKTNEYIIIHLYYHWSMGFATLLGTVSKTTARGEVFPALNLLSGTALRYDG